MRFTLIVILTAALSLTVFGQVETPDTNKFPPNSAAVEGEPLRVIVDTLITEQKIQDPQDTIKSGIPLKTPVGIDIRWGWSMLADDGSFLTSPLVLNNWSNVTLRSLPTSFSVHIPYRVSKTGSSSQFGVQSFYSASEALIIAGSQNRGTAHYFSINADFRNNFRKIFWFGNVFSAHINYGLGYTYRSVALYNHEPIIHFGLGGTSWLTNRFGITVAGTGNFGTLHAFNGYASYVQVNLYGVYRL